MALFNSSNLVFSPYNSYSQVSFLPWAIFIISLLFSSLSIFSALFLEILVVSCWVFWIDRLYFLPYILYFQTLLHILILYLSSKSMSEAFNWKFTLNFYALLFYNIPFSFICSFTLCVVCVCAFMHACVYLLILLWECYRSFFF